MTLWSEIDFIKLYNYYYVVPWYECHSRIKQPKKPTKTINNKYAIIGFQEIINNCCNKEIHPLKFEPKKNQSNECMHGMVYVYNKVWTIKKRKEKKSKPNKISTLGISKKGAFNILILLDTSKVWLNLQTNKWRDWKYRNGQIY